MKENHTKAVNVVIKQKEAKRREMNLKKLLKQFSYWLYKITGGELEPAKPPLPKPIERRKITGSELYQIIRDKFPEGDIHLSDPWSEAHYSLCDIEDIEAFLDVDETNHYQYVRHKFDCDDFATFLWGQFSTPDWAHFAIGLFWSDVHAMVMCVDANEDVWLIEPQNDEKRSDLLDWQGTKMRFTIV